MDVISDTARNAVGLAYDEVIAIADEPFELEVVGPEGGVAAHRYAGFESLIGHQMLFARRSSRNQLELPLAV